MMDYAVVSLEERFDLFEAQDAVAESVWPEFMLHDPVAGEYWGSFIRAFPDLQLMLMDRDAFLAIVNTVPIRHEGPLDDLPDGGWDWGVRSSVENHRAGIEPNLLMGVQIVINADYQGRGLSTVAVREMAALARRRGFDRLVIPVRPSDKHRFPLIPMDDYLRWERSPGLPYDNWLRVHVRAGGRVIRTCPEAMRIPGTVAQWREWTGLEFPGSGDYVVPGALSPVRIDLDTDEGLYVEPNVWTVHETDR